MSPSNLEKIKRWVKGPEFFWEEESRWPQSKEKEVNDISDNPEVKKTASVNVSLNIVDQFVQLEKDVEGASLGNKVH